ncbi:MAG TPA: sulfite exporter TauE/SafE family protein [Dermatophilaceae bacterium]|nr:sulfite exporter TauE/SafE family protein [Dermatophilaceae bacterium]
MPWYEVVALLVAGMAAGTINTIVGSGTLITFPTLLFFGVPPLVANVSNTVGLVAGGLTGIHGYRAELAGQGSALRHLVPASLLGAVTGAFLLLKLPESAFETIVPVLIAASLVLVLLGPRIQAWAAVRHPHHDSLGRHLLLTAGVFATGVYGGYFGAAQGILLVGIMSVLMTIGLQKVNALKNVMSTVVNAVAAVIFMLVAWERINWSVAALIAVGSLAGGYVGARVGRQLSPRVLRAVIVVIGVAAIAKMVT